MWLEHRLSALLQLHLRSRPNKGFGKDSRKTVRESFKCWDLVRLILETWQYMEWMLGCLCDLHILPHPWPWPCIFKVRFWNNVCQELEVWFSWSKRDVRQYSWAMTLTLDFHGQIFLKSHIPGMVWQIDMIWNVNYVRATSFIFSCDQAALWMVFSVRRSVCLSITTFWLCSHNRIVMKFSGAITNDKSDVHAKGQGQRSKVKVTEVMTPFSRFRTVTPVWIHIWWWNDAQNLMLLRRGALLFFKVICQISRSHGSKKRRIWPRLGLSGL